MSHPIHQLIEFLPSPGAVKKENPLSPTSENFIHHSRETVRAILEGRDDRLLAIVGPCSIHHQDSAIEFARRLIILQKEIQDSFFLVMRVYSEKSRTKTGWKGILNDPLLDGTEDIAKGIQVTRELLLTLADMGVPTATEFLDPIASRYYEDLITWGCIGARTSESQTHRLMASGLSMPIAFKNSTQGSIDVAINGMISASIPHRKLCVGEEGNICIRHTAGNPDLHIALRGGNASINYDRETIEQVRAALKKNSLPEKIIVDCSHDNSPNDENDQELAFMNVLEQIGEGNTAIRGVILESHLKQGNQKLSAQPLSPEISVTDSCLGWDSTAELLRAGAKVRQSEKKGPERKTATCAV